MLLVPGTKKKAEIVLVDVTALSLGIKITGGIMSVLVPRNSVVPTRKSNTYTTEEDNQPSIEIEVYQVNCNLVDRNNFICWRIAKNSLYMCVCV